jgi:hypothetical protein
MENMCSPACGGMDGASLEYDAEALQGVKRLTLKTPVGE